MVDFGGGGGIMDIGGENVKMLPKADEAVIPIEKFTMYALNTDKQEDKAKAFELALGYNAANAGKLIDNIRKNLALFPALPKGNLKGYGDVYQVEMVLVGENGRSAKVMTGWIDDFKTGEMRLTSAYVNK